MEIKTETSYTRNIKCSDVYTESAADYSLPDYLGDVRKILFTEASLRPSGRFAGGDEVEFSGVVVYNLVYLDSENNLSSVEFTSDYDYSVKCSGESYKDSISDTRVSNYAIRLVGPRKISARASLVGSVRLSESSTVSVSGNAFETDSTPEVSTKSVGVRSSRISSVIEREYAEQVASLEGAIADEVAIIYTFAEAIADSVSSEGDSVCVKGKLRMNAIVKNEDQPPYSVEKLVGFEENIDFDGLSSDMILSPKLTVSSLKASVNPTENGCEVVVNGIVELCVVGDCNEQVDLLLDAYLKSAPTENSYEDFNYLSLADSASVKGTHNAELNRSEIESDSLREVILMTATPKVERVECNDGVVNIFGEVRYSGIASEQIEDKISYVSLKFSSPFVTNVNINCQNCENLVVDARVSAHGASASLDANKVYASCTLESSVVVCEERREEILSSSRIKEDENYESKGARITVYYPTDDDTLFSVAKRFHTSSLKVARDNDISESVFASGNPEGKLTGVKKLIIY